ncbi:unnamed protein product [Sympodiomycopsis kandeliae]
MAESSASSSQVASTSSGTSLATLVRTSLPLTWPIPNPAREADADLIPAEDIAHEQDLLLNIDSLRAWRAYIAHIETANTHTRSPPDIHLSPQEAALLGPLASKQNRLALRRIVSIYERALQHFPNSFSLHADYLLARARFVLGDPKGGYAAVRKRINRSLNTSNQDEQDVYQWQAQSSLDGVVGYSEWLSLVSACERSIQWLPQMPRLHLFYTSIFLHPNCPAPLSLTHARRTFDRSLRILPPSLHIRIWVPYLQWAEQAKGETGLRVWRRYIQVDPSYTERYVKMLLHTDQEDQQPSPARILEAAKLLLRLATSAAKGSYTSPDGKSPLDLFIEWLDLVDEYPEECGLDEDDEQELQTEGVTFPRDQDLQRTQTLLPVRNILLSTLPSYPDQAGRLWAGLATYHLKRGEMDLAKQTFEQGIKSVVTVRDFSTIFDAYVESEEGIISYLMTEMEEQDTPEEDEEAELDTRMESFEALIASRPFLVNDVMIRRNPSDVVEWEKRIALHGDDDEEIIKTYQRAIETINPRKAVGNYYQLFVNFAKFYCLGGSAGQQILEQVQSGEVSADTLSDDDLPDPDLASARAIYEKAVTIPFAKVDDLASIWISWAEMELQFGHYRDSLRVMSRATAPVSATTKANKVSYFDESLSPQTRLFKSLKLWSYYTDLEESIGSTEGVQRAYDRILELKIANAQTILNYASFLESRQYHEESYKVYERGIESFGYPIVFELWNVYLSKFIQRYKGGKVERTRDLFEQAVANAPGKYSKVLYIKYGQFEETYGLARRALEVYKRATQAVDIHDRFEMFTFYIAKTASNFGLAATRPVYESAISSLPDSSAATMCLRFARLETKLGEIDRGRGIYRYASQFCDPRVHVSFWKEWNSFEIEHGTEETFREMLRIKRSVQALFNTDLSYLSAVQHQQTDKEKKGVEATGMFVAAQTEKGKGKQADQNEGEGDIEDEPLVAANSERIDVDEEGDGGDDDDDDDLM